MRAINNKAQVVMDRLVSGLDSENRHTQIDNNKPDSDAMAVVQDINLSAVIKIADEIEEYLINPIGDHIFGEQEIQIPYVSLKTLITSVQVPPRTTLTYREPERTYHVRATSCEWEGTDESEWIVHCSRSDWGESMGDIKRCVCTPPN